MEASIVTQVVLPASLFLVMFGMGLSLKVEDFSRILLHPKAAVVGILCQMLMLPLVGFFIVFLFNLSTELAVGLMILTFCPGGVTSNMFSYLAKGDTALSVSLTALVSLVTPFTIPTLTVLMMNYFLAESQTFSMPVIKTIAQLLVITIIPVMIGMIIYHKLPIFSAKADKSVKIGSVILLFFIIAGIVVKEWQNMASYFIDTGLATFTLNISTLVLGFCIALWFGLMKPQAISISIEVGIQNGTLALFVAGTILQNAVMTIPAVTYSLIMFVTGALFVLIAKKC